MTTEAREFRDMIRLGRKERGMTQAELGERVGMSQRWVASLEGNEIKRPVAPDMLGRLADALGLSFDEMAVASGVVRTYKAAAALRQQAAQTEAERDRLLELHGRLDPLLLRLTGEDIDTLERIADTLARAADTRQSADPAPSPRRQSPSSPGTPGSPSGASSPSADVCSP